MGQKILQQHIFHAHLNEGKKNIWGSQLSKFQPLLVEQTTILFLVAVHAVKIESLY